MRGSLSIGMSAFVAAVVTHGMVFSAVNLDEPLPVSTYQGFFQYVVLGAERLWSYAYGWQPMSHIEDFGRFYAPAVQLICPLIGFALFWMMSRHKVGLNFWKPMAIALLLALPSSYIGLVPAYALPWVEMARTTLVLLIIVWSVGAIHLPKLPLFGIFEGFSNSSTRACI